MEITIVLHTGETFVEKVSGDIEKLTYDNILSAFHKSEEEWLFVKNGRFIGNVSDTVFDDVIDEPTPLRVYVVDLTGSGRKSEIQRQGTVASMLSGIFGSGLAYNLPQPTTQATTQPRYLDIIRTMVSEHRQASEGGRQASEGGRQASEGGRQASEGSERREASVVSDSTYASSIATLREMGFTHSEPVMRRYIRLYGGDIEMIANFFLNMTTDV